MRCVVQYSAVWGMYLINRVQQCNTVKYSAVQHMVQYSAAQCGVRGQEKGGGRAGYLGCSYLIFFNYLVFYIYFLGPCCISN